MRNCSSVPGSVLGRFRLKTVGKQVVRQVQKGHDFEIIAVEHGDVRAPSLLKSAVTTSFG
jgi:hypothetical protein